MSRLTEVNFTLSQRLFSYSQSKMLDRFLEKRTALVLKYCLFVIEFRTICRNNLLRRKAIMFQCFFFFTIYFQLYIPRYFFSSLTSLACDFPSKTVYKTENTMTKSRLDIKLTFQKLKHMWVDSSLVPLCLTSEGAMLGPYSFISSLITGLARHITHFTLFLKNRVTPYWYGNVSFEWRPRWIVNELVSGQ